MEDEHLEEEPPLAVEIPLPALPNHLPAVYSEDPPATVGVTVVTGYLGAGKSTLVNHILSTESRRGKRIAPSPGAGAARPAEGTARSYLLETTGLANPAPLASVLWLDEQLESSVTLDSIITVVDAKNLRLQLRGRRDSDSFPEAFLQIAFADVVVLNKVDLISNENGHDSVEELKKEIKSINSIASIVRAVRCQVNMSDILHRRDYDGTHLARRTSVDLDKFRAWIEDILWEKQHSMDIYRCKGILSIRDSEMLHTLQAVREIYEIVPARKWKEDERQTNKIVFIGHNLDESVLLNSLKSCTLMKRLSVS
ncbi:hypothetical protein MLD38_005354 [Melastoma candidum]|uniref:Uncharacterized protein n=1 Tax=Melastoma candidum TaxID=119954 RepID=A0ACB9SDF6_9MYRT|nr:hypothetical protein MLD38_005354 [Melastoma candidum]